MKPLTTHEEFCLKIAAHFVAARGRTPATRTRQQFTALPEAQAYDASIGDGRTMSCQSKSRAMTRSPRSLKHRILVSSRLRR